MKLEALVAAQNTVPMTEEETGAMAEDATAIVSGHGGALLLSTSAVSVRV